MKKEFVGWVAACDNLSEIVCWQYSEITEKLRVHEFYKRKGKKRDWGIPYDGDSDCWPPKKVKITVEVL